MGGYQTNALIYSQSKGGFPLPCACAYANSNPCPIPIALKMPSQLAKKMCTFPRGCNMLAIAVIVQSSSARKTNNRSDHSDNTR
jgi:hypothetical protein